MASLEEHHRPLYNDHDLDDDDDDGDSPPQNDVVVDEEDDDVDVDDDDDSSSSSHLATAPGSTTAVSGKVTVAVAAVHPNDSLHPDPKRQRIDEFAVVAATAVVGEKKPSAIDDSRKLFQRLWTDEDEIELLQGFLEYTTQRGANSSSHHHHDTTAFYDQIKSRLQLDFNKNQLVEKLRRLKKKYRNIMSKMSSGKEFIFKSAHDQATFEISRKIWSNGGAVIRGIGGGSAGLVTPPPQEDGGLEDELISGGANFIGNSPNFNLNTNPNGIDAKTPRSRKRSRGGAVKVEERHAFLQQYYQPVILPAPGPSIAAPPPRSTATASAAATATATATETAAAATPIPTLIEETVRSCLSPVFKELLNSAMNLNGSKGLGMGMTLNPIPLGFVGGIMSAEMVADEKWRKQQMLELEVYSRRLELVQDQIKAKLEELRSIGS